jgi:hypothetical protein
MPPMGTMARIAVIVACAAVLYVLWHYRLGTAGALALGLGAIIFSRAAHRSNLYGNSFGDSRDYSIRPAARAMLKALGCFVGGLVWAVLITVFVNRHALPDNALVAYGLLGTPIVLSLVAFMFYLFKAMSIFKYGQQKNP